MILLDLFQKLLLEYYDFSLDYSNISHYSIKYYNFNNKIYDEHNFNFT